MSPLNVMHHAYARRYTHEQHTDANQSKVYSVRHQNLYTSTLSCNTFWRICSTWQFLKVCQLLGLCCRLLSCHKKKSWRSCTKCAQSESEKCIKTCWDLSCHTRKDVCELHLQQLLHRTLAATALVSVLPHMPSYLCRKCDWLPACLVGLSI